MRYYTFMMRNYLNENNATGDLARDMKRDKDKFPVVIKGSFEKKYKKTRDYLDWQCGACDGCLEAFEETWKEYTKCEKKL